MGLAHLVEELVQLRGAHVAPVLLVDLGGERERGGHAVAGARRDEADGREGQERDGVLELGAHLAGRFDAVDDLRLRVGALSRHATNRLRYNFTWSIDGVPVTDMGDSVVRPEHATGSSAFYFDFDSYTIKPEFQSLIDGHARFLKANTQRRISIEGHTDERGGREYNLALGNRRATVVKEYLVSLGVPSGRIAVVSKGKEQPFCTEESESCWQQNRRGHFIVTAK